MYATMALHENMQYSAAITNNARLIVSAVDVKYKSKEQIYSNFAANALQLNNGSGGEGRGEGWSRKFNGFLDVVVNVVAEALCCC